MEQRLYRGLERPPIFTDCCFFAISNLPSALSTWLEHACVCVTLDPLPNVLGKGLNRESILKIDYFGYGYFGLKKGLLINNWQFVSDVVMVKGVMSL